jgi:hypothetical protein
MAEIKIKAGDAVPSGSFKYVPWSPELETPVCVIALVASSRH